MKAKSKTTWKNLGAEEDKPITLRTMLSHCLKITAALGATALC